MKILYFLFAFLFLAFLSEPGNAHHLCGSQGGRCHQYRCRPRHDDLGQRDCPWRWKCCRPWKGK
ncbi:hypothetical protein E2320_018381 [Naja naja]|nr:hypothetical protein E2320_018381 [Naja naja]